MDDLRPRGFTLIELLVVIAIIGLLASIVLASLSTARNKGADAAIKSDLQSIQVQAELDNVNGCYVGTGGYCAVSAITVTGPCTGACASYVFGDPAIVKAAQGIQTVTGGIGLMYGAQNNGATAWALAAQLKADPALAWCVDSSGQSKQEGTAGGAALTSSSIAAFVVNYSTCL